MEEMLPPLSPLTVVKVPLIRERPEERRTANNQEMLLTLLNKRHKKYLARIRDYRGDHARDHAISEGEKREPNKISYDLIPPSIYADETSIKSN